MAGLSREEQEVIITTSAADSDAEVYAADPVYIRKLDKLCERCPDCYKLVSQNEYSKTYRVSLKKLITFKAPVVMTEERKKELAERAARMREARNVQV
jgi:hypothetical protein